MLLFLIRIFYSYLLALTISLKSSWILLNQFDIEGDIRKKFQKCGITIGGTNPCDIEIYDRRFYAKIATDPEVSLGETFMEGWWAANDLPKFFDKIVCEWNLFINCNPNNSRWRRTKRRFRQAMIDVFNMKVVKPRLCDVDLYETILDSSMNYGCGYWKNASCLEEAQRDKMELIARKLKLKPGMKILDIGCGWGSLAKYLAANFDVAVVGCTLYPEQAEYARKLCSGLLIEIHLANFRQIKGKFDRIVSIGRFQHLDESKYGSFFKFAANCLSDDGLFLFHTTGVNHPNVKVTDRWAQKYMFPTRVFPYHMDITEYTDGLFIIEDWQNMGFHYAATVMAWIQNFEKPKLQRRFEDNYYRMWQYYLHGIAAAFRLRKLQLWEIILSKNGVTGGYDSER